VEQIAPTNIPKNISIFLCTGFPWHKTTNKSIRKLASIRTMFLLLSIVNMHRVAILSVPEILRDVLSQVFVEIHLGSNIEIAGIISRKKVVAL
jgi:hypothetical protein